jgi:hypothetical protein
MSRDDNSAPPDQQTASSGSPPVVTESTTTSIPATGKAKNKSMLRMVVGAVALTASLVKLVIWLATPAHPTHSTVTYRPIMVSPGGTGGPPPLAKCAMLFPTGQGAVPGINCLK